MKKLVIEGYLSKCKSVTFVEGISISDAYVLVGKEKRYLELEIEPMNYTKVDEIIVSKTKKTLTFEIPDDFVEDKLIFSGYVDKEYKTSVVYYAYGNDYIQPILIK